jgi:type IV secretion system protein VirB8
MSLGDSMKNLKGSLGQKQSKDGLQTSKNWYTDQFESMLVQRNIFLVLTLVFSFTISALMLGIWYYTSKTNIEPFVIEIEPKTGVTTVVYPLESKALSDEEAIKRYFIWNYVKLREEYFRSTFDYVFAQVNLFSSGEEYANFNRQNNINNKQSPYYTFGINGTKQVKLKSLTFLTDNVAQVRFKTEIAGVNLLGTDKIATVDFEFSNIGLNENQRLLNPLGFKVTNYRVEDELVK